MDINEYKNALINGQFDEVLGTMYASDKMGDKKKRIRTATDKFSSEFPDRTDIHVYSAPGRTEIGGNHTDHQHGCVLAAAVDLDVIGVVSFHDDGIVRIKSEGYRPFEISAEDLNVHKNEKGTPAIARGVLAGFKKICSITGFDMYITSDVIGGSGLSSSAAFENLISVAVDCYCNDGKSGAVTRAKIGQYAENVYFGKKSGLMDQLVSAIGGSVFIDFENIKDPMTEKIDFDFASAGYSLVITNTKGSHADLTDDYSEIRTEMESVAEYFGKHYLREVDEDEFRSSIKLVRQKTSDRAVLRAHHFFEENRRAFLEAECLKNGDIGGFLDLVRQSGLSSERYLQNLYSVRTPFKQEIPLALMTAGQILGDAGAVRVHGGGFAGTIQAFVPSEKKDEYIKAMNDLFGDDSCFILSVRQAGGTEIV